VAQLRQLAAWAGTSRVGIKPESPEFQCTEATAFPRTRMLSIQEWFHGKEQTLPVDTVNDFRKSDVKKGEEEGQWSRKTERAGSKE